MLTIDTLYKNRKYIEQIIIYIYLYNVDTRYLYYNIQYKTKKLSSSLYLGL